MLERLGDVLYWLASATAGLLIAGTAVLLYSSSHMKSADQWYLGGLAGCIALAIWIAGRAARYVLTGR